ncbi:MAG: WD40/YVTN/BNR-like repeat-containing protein [Solirubrobacteraceae bacterium]
MRRAIALVGVALGLAGGPSSASPHRAHTSRRRAIAPVSLAFPTPDDGWVLASRGSPGAELLATHDGGMSWVTEWSGVLDPSEVVATDPDHAWVLAQRCPAETCASVLLGTSDAGRHWSAPVPLTLFGKPPLPLHVSQVAFASPTLGLAAARDASCRDGATGPPPACPGWILETDDGGRHWRALGLRDSVERGVTGGS